MINKNLIKLMKELKNNSEYLEKMDKIKNSQELYDYCSTIVSGYSKEEFDDFMRKMVGAYEKIKQLSDENMANVTGGKGIFQWPKNAHEFRLLVDPGIPENEIDDKGNVKKTYPNGVWTNNMQIMTGYFGMASNILKVVTIMYGKDTDKMSPQEFAKFIDDIITNGIGAT
jgi:hypothetical protein